MSGLQYRDTWYSLAPPWLTTDDAEKYMFTLELARDLLVEKSTQATAIRFPGKGDPSQLPYLAHDRVLEQGIAEPDASFVTRLVGYVPTHKRAGSAPAALEQIQAYMTGLQPGVGAALPALTIIGGCHSTVTRWHTLYQGDAQGAEPTLSKITPSNFNWDGASKPWRAWLVLYMSQVATGQTGGVGTITAAIGVPVGTGSNVGGVWVPSAAAPVNTPFLQMGGLTGLTSANVGQWITISGAGNPSNNGTWPIVEVVSGTQCIISNPAGVSPDASLKWSIGAYPWIGPDWSEGSLDGSKWGQGEDLTTTPPSTPPKDTGTNVGGVWQPTLVGTYGCTGSWGLTCPSTTIQSIRRLLKRWKSAATYYPNIIVAFDGGTGAAGSAYSSNSTPGAGNPDGSFGPVGKLVGGVWVPTRGIASPFDAYCQGTGTHVSCSVENVT
jgi:hypothetical protein